MKGLLLVSSVPILFILLAFAGCGDGPSVETAREQSAGGDEHGAAPAAQCVRHGLPKTLCFMCDPALREPGRLWCNEHDRYEDRCFLCHPELEDPDRLWCAEHNVYEDECTFCHPNLGDAARPTAIAGNELECPEHRVLEKECGICHPELAASLTPGSGLKIRFESATSASLAGVETAIPTGTGDLTQATFLARVTWDQNHFTRVTPLVRGVLQKVSADVGRSVSRGDLLATLISPEVARAKSAYLSARIEEELKLTILTREKKLVAQRVSAQQDLDQARVEYQIAKNTTTTARQQLLNLGLTERAIGLLEATGSASSELDILAPMAGTVVDRQAVSGEAVGPGEALFKIARLSSLWLELSIPESEVVLASVGQEVTVTFDGHPGLEATGRVTWIGSSVDEQSRMVKGRAEVPNPDLQLRNGMFGQARIHSKNATEGLHVPASAVQQIDQQAFVFVLLEEDLFEIRRVTLGETAGSRIAVRAGLEPYDEIVVTHSFILKSEFLKSRLGAGCVHE